MSKTNASAPPAASAATSVSPVSASQPTNAASHLRLIFVRHDSYHRGFPRPAKDFRCEPRAASRF
jgi:hypothetical protein